MGTRSPDEDGVGPTSDMEVTGGVSSGAGFDWTLFPLLNLSVIR